MTAHADFDAFVEKIGARRREAVEAAPPLMEVLEQAEEELRVQNEALFAAQTELAEEQRAFLDLFDLAPVAYAVTRADGQILRLNAPAFALLGRPANFAAGKPLAVFVAPADRPAFRRALGRPVANGRVESWRMCITPRHAEPVECRVFVRAVAGASACTGPVCPTTAARDAPETAGPLLYWIITPELGDPTDDLV